MIANGMAVGLVLLAVLAGLAGAATPVIAADPGSADAEPTELVIRGERMTVWPADDLRDLGFIVEDIPRSQNAAWLYLEAINAYEDLPADLQEAFDQALDHGWPTQNAELAAYLDKPGNRKALELMRKASAMPRCQMPYFGDPGGSVIGILLPNLSNLRFLAKLMVVDGLRLESQGKLAEAQADYLTCAHTANHIGRGMTLIENLVGIAMWRLAEDRLGQLILRDGITPRQLKQLARELDQYRDRVPTCEIGLEQERNFTATVVDEACARPLRLLTNPAAFAYDGGGNGATNARPTDGWGRLEKRLGQVFLPDQAIKRHISDFHDQVVAAAELGPAHAPDLQQAADQAIRAVPTWDIVTTIVMPSLGRASELSWESQSSWHLLRSAVAVRLYALQHDGQPPANLASLESDLPDDATLDLYADAPLRYQADGKHWRLYSVGPDRTDDGGRAGENWREGDRVIQYPPMAVPTEDGEQ